MSASQGNDLLSDLNPEQQKAVLYRSGPLVVLAGAGSGKTRVLTRRIALLIAEGVYPEQILAITFTNKAAGEMKSRVEELLGGLSSGMWISTFHSACVRILRRSASRLGFEQSFSIYDDTESRRLIDLIIEELNLDPKRHSTRAISQIISSAKNEMLTCEDYDEQASNEFERRVARIFFEYQKRLREANAFDFDDLLFKTVQLLKENEDLAESYRERFLHLLVDEYQDTNAAQNELVSLIGAKNRNVCVVGDTDQSIYAFRGADFRNLLNFRSLFPEAVTIVLNQNYRSTQTILDAANAVIDNNESRVKKQLWSALGEGEKIRIFKAPNEYYEAGFVADEISRMTTQKEVSYQDIAVFYRTNAQSRSIEEALMDRSIPYVMLGGVRFFDRKEVKDILAYMKLTDNPRDEISIRRVINIPKRKIGAKTLDEISRYAQENDFSFYEALLHADECSVTKAAKSGIKSFLALLQALSGVKEQPPKDILEEVLTLTSYRDALLQEAEQSGYVLNQALSRLEVIDELVSVAMEHDDLESFLSSVTLVAVTDDLSDGEGAVTLMTMHSAKGLEFDTVFLTGMEEGLFPHERSLSDPDALEEERRLCYVGITRAKKRLYLTHTYSRTIFGRTLDSLPSRFLREMPKEHIRDMSAGDALRQPYSASDSYFFEEPEGRVFGLGNFVKSRPFGSESFIDKKPPEFLFAESDAADRSAAAPEHNAILDKIRPGVMVRHDRYGVGTIKEIEGQGRNSVAIITFPDGRERKFLLEAAPLVLLEN